MPIHVLARLLHFGGPIKPRRDFLFFSSSTNLQVLELPQIVSKINFRGEIALRALGAA